MADPGQAAADAALKQAEQARNSARDRTMADIGEGATCNDADDASSKTILVRGCDPIMAERAGEMLPPLLGNVNIEAATQDDRFFELLNSKKYDAVFFAPGACRWSAARKPIPAATLRQLDGPSTIIEPKLHNYNRPRKSSRPARRRTSCPC